MIIRFIDHFIWPQSFIIMLLSRLALKAYPTIQVRYAFSLAEWQQIPKPWNLHMTKDQRRAFKNPLMRPLKPYGTRYNDTLFLPGLEGEKLFDLYQDFINGKEIPLSSQFVALLLYNFAKGGYLNKSTWTRLEPYMARNRGQFSMRSIFGCLYSSIRYGSEQYLQFFIEEMAGQKLSFCDIEAIQIVEAFNLSSHQFDEKLKHEFWDTYFKPYFLEHITETTRVHNFKTALQIFDAFNGFNYYQDEGLWNMILGWLERRKGWKRVEIIQRIYPLTGTFPKAKEVFDLYYNELSTNENVLWRYNLEQLRYYTSQEMIKKSQDNIKLNPSDRTLVLRKDQARFNQEYYQWQKDGARQKEAQLIKDKAQSLAYAIKDRYESLKKDKADFSKLSLQQFNDLFGGYDASMMYKPKPVVSKFNQEQQEEQEVKPKKK